MSCLPMHLKISGCRAKAFLGGIISIRILLKEIRGWSQSLSEEMFTINLKKKINIHWCLEFCGWEKKSSSSSFIVRERNLIVSLNQ